MRLINAEALRTKSRPAKEYSPEMLVVGLGYVLDAQTIEPANHGFFSWFERENGNPLDGYDYEWGWQCSECQYEYPPSNEDAYATPGNNFCPNCGADMREVTHDK